MIDPYPFRGGSTVTFERLREFPKHKLQNTKEKADETEDPLKSLSHPWSSESFTPFHTQKNAENRHVHHKLKT